jgi:hypothetical protein
MWNSPVPNGTPKSSNVVCGWYPAIWTIACYLLFPAPLMLGKISIMKNFHNRFHRRRVARRGRLWRVVKSNSKSKGSLQTQPFQRSTWIFDTDLRSTYLTQRDLTLNLVHKFGGIGCVRDHTYRYEILDLQIPIQKFPLLPPRNFPQAKQTWLKSHWSLLGSNTAGCADRDRLEINQRSIPIDRLGSLASKDLIFKPNTVVFSIDFPWFLHR